MKKNRFTQANAEAFYCLILAALYALWWFSWGYIGSLKRFLGMPLWFFGACVAGPILFCFLAHLMVKYLFKEINLHDE